LLGYALNQQAQIAITLKDGRTTETLADARAVILSLPEFQQCRPTGNMQPCC